MNSIFLRKSIRKFIEKDVEKEKVSKLISAGFAAPSAGNQRPWEIYVITNKQIIKKLSEITIRSECAKNAPLLIVPCINYEFVSHKDYYGLDMSACCENILIEAVELGLGAVWLGIYPNKERIALANKIMGLQSSLDVFSIIPIGYPCEPYEMREKSINSERIHYIT